MGLKAPKGPKLHMLPHPPNVWKGQFLHPWEHATYTFSHHLPSIKKSQHCASHNWSTKGFTGWSRASQPAAKKVDIALPNWARQGVSQYEGNLTNLWMGKQQCKWSTVHSCPQLPYCTVWRCVTRSTRRQHRAWQYLQMAHDDPSVWHGWWWLLLLERRGQEGGLRETRETRKGVAWALSLALTWGKQGMVLLTGIRVTQHPEGALHFFRDMYSPYGLEFPGKQFVRTTQLQELSLLTDSLFRYLSPSNT